MKPTITNLSSKVNDLDTRTARLETETSIQFKDLFNRVKRIESILIGTSGAIVLLLISIIMRM
jgi:hypothetical protein